MAAVPQLGRQKRPWARLARTVLPPLHCSCSHAANTPATTAAVAVAQIRGNTSWRRRRRRHHHHHHRSRCCRRRRCRRCRRWCHGWRRNTLQSLLPADGGGVTVPAAVAAAGAAGRGIAAATAAVADGAARADDAAAASAEAAATAMRRLRLHAAGVAARGRLCTDDAASATPPPPPSPVACPVTPHPAGRPAGACAEICTPQPRCDGKTASPPAPYPSFPPFPPLYSVLILLWIELQRMVMPPSSSLMSSHG